jgi:hypothetical protein
LLSLLLLLSLSVTTEFLPLFSQLTLLSISFFPSSFSYLTPPRSSHPSELIHMLHLLSISLYFYPLSIYTFLVSLPFPFYSLFSSLPP